MRIKQKKAVLILGQPSLLHFKPKERKIERVSDSKRPSKTETKKWAPSTTKELSWSSITIFWVSAAYLLNTVVKSLSRGCEGRDDFPPFDIDKEQIMVQERENDQVGRDGRG